MLPTKERLRRVFEVVYSYCAICRSGLESFLHLFLKCSGIQALAFASIYGANLDGWTVYSIEELIGLCFNPFLRLCIEQVERSSFTIFLLLYFIVPRSFVMIKFLKTSFRFWRLWIY